MSGSSDYSPDVGEDAQPNKGDVTEHEPGHGFYCFKVIHALLFSSVVSCCLSCRVLNIVCELNDWSVQHLLHM